VIVEVQSGPDIDRVANANVRRVVHSDEVEMRLHAILRIGAGAQIACLERRPLQPVIRVEPPPIVAAEHREPVGQRRLLLA
jgi:hypothetical protein